MNCIQEVRHGVNNILQVDPRFCPSPAPIAQQYCNIIDCPVQWITGSWTKVIYLNCHGMACTNLVLKLKDNYLKSLDNMFIDFYFKCSKHCGGGVKHRKVFCRQRIALGDVADKPPEHCSFKKKPEMERPCNSSPCSPFDSQIRSYSGKLQSYRVLVQTNNKKFQYQ